MTMPPPQLDSSWKEALQAEWSKDYLKELAAFLAIERQGKIAIYPSKIDVFNAFNQTPFHRVKVVIMGQDPYHGPNQANGLSFSVNENVPLPPSLKNIFKEIKDDLGVDCSGGSLIAWAKQGVLMLNAILTVRANSPHSHHKKGWELFTDAVLDKLAEREDPIIFVLWGKTAQEKCRSVLEKTRNRHFVLTAAHPSPYSANSGFFGCRHFSKINEILKKQGKEPINWMLL